ncbi:MAG TPA: YggS family pyridoxal phosphate-dependent enzyme [Acidimicrobiia bacterium]|nr:YggS family pyridoxal phosphate-dependent enzyme [Acidimicrobiia bacterium]
MAAGLTAVRTAVTAAAVRSGRDPGSVTLVAVSKEASDAAVVAAHSAGVSDFGENRADALADRAGSLPSEIRWHFIGRLQTNKVRRIRPVVTLLHSLDRPSLAEQWLKGAGTPPPVLVQVNVSGEARKAGVEPAQAASFVEAALDMGLDVRGLMTMAPLDADPEASRPHFAALRRLRDDLRERHASVGELSMGMSGDYEVAVEEGATILRVGWAIFRPSRHED